MHTKVERKRGLYETEWGNTAYLASAHAKTAKDLDSGERCPVECLVRFIRAVKHGEMD